MKRSILVVSIAAALFGLAPIVGAGDQKRKAADDTSTVQLDVAMDASSATSQLICTKVAPGISQWGAAIKSPTVGASVRAASRSRVPKRGMVSFPARSTGNGA